ncbi:MAG: Ig-like domain-containing protein, partial [Verrucomicrobiota bacterium]
MPTERTTDNLAAAMFFFMRTFRRFLPVSLFVCTLLILSNDTFGTVTITPASGGTNILADTSANAISPAWTTLGPISIDEVSPGNKNNFSSGSGVTLILKAPAGFQFNTSVTPNITFTAGQDITAASIAVTDSATVTITLTVSGTGNVDKLTLGSTTGLQVRPNSGSPLATAGQIYRPTTGGSAVIAGITTTSNTNGTGGSNFGSLSEVVGAAAKLAFTSQPGSAITGVIFGAQPVVKTQDQFGNLSTTGVGSSLNVTNTLFAGTGVLLGNTILNIGTSAGNGTVTFTNLQIDVAGTNKQLKASATGLSDGLSAVFAVNGRPLIANIPDQSTGEDTSTAPISFVISDAETPGSGLAVSGVSSNTNLVSANGITFGGSDTNRTITLTPVANQSGTTTITITVDDGTSTASSSFVLTVNSINDAPTLNSINDLAVNEDSGTGVVNLSAITSGATNEIQVLTITATSSNPSLIPNPTVTYTSPNPNGSISFAPLANTSGSATITVKVQDNGGTNFGGLDTFTRTFLVTVNPVNDPPTLNLLSPVTVEINSGTQIVSLTGITSGATNETQVLTVTATSSNPALVPNPTVTYTSPNTGGSISFASLTNASGSATITVKVQDNGGTNLGGVDSVTQQFLFTAAPRTDLAISQTASPNPAYIGGSISFLLTVTNRGPSTASNVVITNFYPTELTFTSATPSQGSSLNQAG